MVRINLIDPKALADQHLIAEYNEILMLVGYVRKYPHKERIPANYVLGSGHIRFFADKLWYLKYRHEIVTDEMKRRGFKPTKKLDTKGLPKGLHNDWMPDKKDATIIKERLILKLHAKPRYYRHGGKKLHVDKLVSKIRSAGLPRKRNA
jgi:deoxyribonuclease (pyrimidine dimer)